MSSHTEPAIGRLVGKAAIVTGGASGIGRATVKRFLAEGADVIVADIDEPPLRQLAAEVGGAVKVVRCDVTREHDLERLMDTAIDVHGRIDIAFANAGAGSVGPITELGLDEWRRVMDVNLTAPFLTIKHAARHMTAGGSIVITASLNSVQPAAGMSAYCCSKAAAAMLAQVSALELGPRGIRVNAIAPGLVRTALTEPLFSMNGVWEEYLANTPVGRYAEPEEIAGLVTYLVSDEASFVSGSLQLIDGAAHTMRYPDLIQRLMSVG